MSNHVDIQEEGEAGDKIKEEEKGPSILNIADPIQHNLDDKNGNEDKMHNIESQIRRAISGGCAYIIRKQRVQG